MKIRIIYRRIASFFLLTAFFVQTFNSAFVIADYYTNTIKYAKNCENKARPQLHCNGNCQMMKKLREQEKEEQQSPERKAENKGEVIPFTIPFFVGLPLPKTTLLSSKQSSSGFNCIIVDPAFSIFHPPCC